MKKLFLFVLIFCSLRSLSQDSLKIREIDSVVSAINQSNLAETSDSIIQNMPDLGLQMKTYVSAFLKGGELIKYADRTNSVRKENGKSSITNTSSVFYYNNKKLIKVEESGGNGADKKVSFEWYYFNDKPLYYTLSSERAEERAELLLTMSKALQDKIQKK